MEKKERKKKEKKKKKKGRNGGGVCSRELGQGDDRQFLLGPENTNKKLYSFKHLQAGRCTTMLRDMGCWWSVHGQLGCGYFATRCQCQSVPIAADSYWDKQIHDFYNRNGSCPLFQGLKTFCFIFFPHSCSRTTVSLPSLHRTFSVGLPVRLDLALSP